MTVSIGDRCMSWISDVREQLHVLNDSRHHLRRFGFLVGTVFAVLGLWILLRGRTFYPGIILAGIGSLLILFGTLAPGLLKYVYRVWMGAAFAVGWIVSRIILIVLFGVVITPIGLILRLFRKRMLDLKYPDSVDTYWVRKPDDRTINYEKMY